jgi:hypothetical protein
MLHEGRIDIPASGMAVVVVVLAMLYGICMGSYSVFRVVDPAVVPAAPWYTQLAATTVKVPALFILTLVVTFPSLYVFNALVGSRLTMVPVLRLLVASLAVNLAVLASLGPIVAFFSVSTESYPFMVLFNVLMFSVAGLLGLVFLLQTLNRLASSAHVAIRPTDVPASSLEAKVPAKGPPIDAELIEKPGALDAIEGHVLGRHVKIVFRCWVIVFALVGAQMGWVLRPFIGSPDQPFQWFRSRESNFFEAVGRTLISLITGSG